jgi:hypothetical protein
MTALTTMNHCTLTVMKTKSLRLNYQNFGRSFLHEILKFSFIICKLEDGNMLKLILYC